MEKSEKEELFREIRLEIRQIVGVIVEHFDDKVALLVEQFESLRNEVREWRHIHGKKIENLEMEIQVLKEN